MMQAIPDAVQLAAAQPARHTDAVTAAVVLERGMQRLVHVADPVAEELQGSGAARGGDPRQARPAAGRRSFAGLVGPVT